MPRLVDKDVSDFRVNFIKEELKELEDAYETQNLEEIADALIDLDYVIKGTGHFHGLPWRALWHEVHRANMEKVRVEGAEDPRSTRPHRFNVVKPEGWKPPDIAGLLNRQKEIAR
jgi:predicted HAD superfamily Cof-like phosphohydrolase